LYKNCFRLQALDLFIFALGDCDKPQCDGNSDDSLLPQVITFYPLNYEKCNKIQFFTDQARALLEPKADAFVQAPDDGALMASYSVFVVEPGSLPGKNLERKENNLVHIML
jgi:hypothetical protein